LGLLSDQWPGFAAGLDRGLFDRRDGCLQGFFVGGADGDQAGVAHDAVAAGEVGFLL